MSMIRFFCTAARNATTSQLAQLRKKTGFTLVNCRKALEECKNDLEKAEEWLKAEAKRLGWEKAMKLQGRTASEGLIAVAKAKNKVVMVEVNCETDFVAKNEKFVSLVQKVAGACIAHPFPQSDTNMKKTMSDEEIGNIRTAEEEKLIDCVAKRIGELGEKIVLKRAICYEADKDVQVDATVHPPVSGETNILTGKYGAFVAYQRSAQNPGREDASQNIGVQLCKHIIGLNPKAIGSEEIADAESVAEESAVEEPTVEQLEADDSVTLGKSPEALLDQEFILDNSMTVRELLKERDLKVVDFHRFQCGEDVEVDKTELKADADGELKGNVKARSA